MNVYRPEETTTFQLYAAALEGTEAQIAGLVEMFLVEVYRNKLCQFTSSIKSKITTHLAQVHETVTACQISGCPKMDQDENESYSMGNKANQEKKENKENIAKKVCLITCVSDASKYEYSLLRREPKESEQ